MTRALCRSSRNCSSLVAFATLHLFNFQGRPSVLPATQNAPRKSSGGDKSKEVMGTKFTFVFQRKISALN